MHTRTQHHIEALIGFLPAALIGVIVMARTDVPASIWLQNLAASLVFPLLMFLPDGWRRFLRSRSFAVAAVLLLAATLLFPGANGIRRWLDVGPLSVHAGLLLTPALILSLAQREASGDRFICAMSVAAACVFTLQSDLSQLCALLAGFLCLGLIRKMTLKRVLMCAVLMALGGVFCALRGQTLEPVPYCEGILTMAYEVSVFLLAAAIIALLLLPLSFLAGKTRDAGYAAVAAYGIVVILFALTGDYPMPIMGYGLSPIAGYWLAASFD